MLKSSTSIRSRARTIGSAEWRARPARHHHDEDDNVDEDVDDDVGDDVDTMTIMRGLPGRTSSTHSQVTNDS